MSRPDGGHIFPVAAQYAAVQESVPHADPVAAVPAEADSCGAPETKHSAAESATKDSKGEHLAKAAKCAADAWNQGCLTAPVIVS